MLPFLIQSGSSQHPRLHAAQLTYGLYCFQKCTGPDSYQQFIQFVKDTKEKLGGGSFVMYFEDFDGIVNCEAKNFHEDIDHLYTETLPRHMKEYIPNEILKNSFECDIFQDIRTEIEKMIADKMPEFERINQKELRLYKKNILHEKISYLTINDFSQAVSGNEHLKIQRLWKDGSSNTVSFIFTIISPDGMGVCDVHTHYLTFPISKEYVESMNIPDLFPRHQKDFARCFPDHVEHMKHPHSDTDRLTKGVAAGLLEMKYFNIFQDENPDEEMIKKRLLEYFGMTSEEFERSGLFDPDKEKSVFRPFGDREPKYYEGFLFCRVQLLFMFGMVNDKLWFFKDVNEIMNHQFKGGLNMMTKILETLGKDRVKEIIEHFLLKRGGIEDTLYTAEKIAEKFEKRRCAVCKKGGMWQVCQQCKKVSYCSKHCQKEDWERHQKECRLCAHCGKVGQFGHCEGCESVHYCSRSCQKKHWKRVHREQCKNIRDCLAPD